MNIAIPTIWFHRGQSYLSLQMKHILEKAGHEIFIYARGRMGDGYIATDGEFNVKNLSRYPAYEIPPKIFEVWLKENKIDIVIFNEEQWQCGLAKIAKEAGVKVYGVVYEEKFDPNDLKFYEDYDCCICPTIANYKRVKATGLPVKYVKWGVDLNLFKPNTDIKREDNQIRFVHCGGWGGAHGRRNTQAVFDCFVKAVTPELQDKTKLLIHLQNTISRQSKPHPNVILQELDFPSREEIVKRYNFSDICIAPTKWSALEYAPIESLACGIPVITTDASPMNEHVSDGYNGYLCKVKEWKEYQNICVKGAEIDEDDLIDKIRYLINNPAEVQKLKENTLKMRNGLDWDVNGKELVKIIEGR